MPILYASTSIAMLDRLAKAADRVAGVKHKLGDAADIKVKFDLIDLASDIAIIRDHLLRNVVQNVEAEPVALAVAAE